MVYTPAEVVVDTVIVSTLEQLGRQGLRLKVADAPEGRPDAESETLSGVPDINVRVIEF